MGCLQNSKIYRYTIILVGPGSTGVVLNESDESMEREASGRHPCKNQMSHTHDCETEKMDPSKTLSLSRTSDIPVSGTLLLFERGT